MKNKCKITKEITKIKIEFSVVLIFLPNYWLIKFIKHKTLQQIIISRSLPAPEHSIKISGIRKNKRIRVDCDEAEGSNIEEVIAEIVELEGGLRK